MGDVQKCDYEDSTYEEWYDEGGRRYEQDETMRC